MANKPDQQELAGVPSGSGEDKKAAVPKSVMVSVMVHKSGMVEAVLLPVPNHWKRKRQTPVLKVVTLEPMEWCIAHARRVTDPIPQAHPMVGI